MCAVWVGGRLKCRGVAVLNRISGLRSVVVVEWLSFGGGGREGGKEWCLLVAMTLMCV